MTAPRIPDALQRKLDTLPEGPGVYLWKDATGRGAVRGQGQAPEAAGAQLLRHRFRRQPEESAAPAAHRGRRDDRRRHRGAVADPREQPHQGVPAAVQRPAQGRQELSVHRGDARGAVPAGARDPAARHPRRALLRTLHRRRRSCGGRWRSSGGSTPCGAATTICPPSAASAPASTTTSAAARRRASGWQSEDDYRRMVDDVVEFLEGRTGDVRSKVREAMLAASEREDFERAKDMRDALRWLERLEEPVSVEVIGTGDADVIGYARDGDDAVGVLCGCARAAWSAASTASWRASRRRQDAAVLSAFLARYYVPAEDRGPGGWWSRSRRRTGTRSASCCPDPTGRSRSGAPRTAGWSWPTHNARHLLESLRIESFETEERAEDPVYALGRDLGLAGAAEPGLHRHLAQPGHATPWARWSGSRPAGQEERVPQVQDPGPGPAGRLRRDARGRHPLPHPPPGRGAAAARPHRDRRRQGPAQRGARRAASKLGLRRRCRS